MTLKRQRFSVPTSASRDVGALLDPQSVALDAPALENIALDRIELDPEQPRRLGLDAVTPHVIHPSDPQADGKRAQLESLKQLAESFRANGQLQPVGVYLHGNRYRLAYGERRVLAARLLGLPSIQAKIFTTRPNNLRAVQMAENLQRADLSLAERIRGMQALIRECAESGTQITTGSGLAATIGMGQSTAYLYWNVVQGPADVRDAIERGRIASLVQAADIAAIADEQARGLAIAAVTGEPAQGPAATAKPATPRSARVGRKPKAVTLGKTKDVAALKHIFEAVLTPAERRRFDGANWNDFAVVGDLFRQMVALVAKRIAKS